MSESYKFQPKKITLIVDYEGGESWTMECDDPTYITIEVDQDGYDYTDGLGGFIKHMVAERWVTTKWLLPHKKSGEKYFTFTRKSPDPEPDLQRVVAEELAYQFLCGGEPAESYMDAAEGVLRVIEENKRP